ncbi:MAG TPA: thioredoxin-disulfide reductase [Candidatus Egerieimonas intestinavium]|uniref:Thioredoxin reductase n=1 Tax=Candidatus Egerieimonas intestinavium TaxID=2840777 RepID=A0A9D1EK87_9FIRM|nr:thioredoxin-disulfide reductase [Candidatus Egerieimonas intestinavium]
MENSYDMIIIGTGPAGLGAAIYGQRALLKILSLEENYVSGGQMSTTYEVDNYPAKPGISGMDLGMEMREHAERMGAEIRRGKVRSIQREGRLWRVSTKKESFLTKTVALAMGARHRLLGVPGEERLTGMGVSYCATCDGAFFKDKTVAVVGGGDVAVEDAVFLARICRKVYLIHRRDQLRAARILQERVKELPNVEILWDSVVTEILGENQVSAAVVENKRLGTSQELPLEGVFVAVGIEPNTELAQGLVELDSQGYVRAGEDGITSEPTIFAAGDIRTKPLRQIVTAVADGANIITSLQEYLLRE